MKFVIKTYLHWNWYKMNIEEADGFGAGRETVGGAETAQKTNVCENKLVQESEKHYSPLCRQVGAHVCALSPLLLIHEFPVFVKMLELFRISQLIFAYIRVCVFSSFSRFLLALVLRPQP